MSAKVDAKNQAKTIVEKLKSKFLLLYFLVCRSYYQYDVKFVLVEKSTGVDKLQADLID